ncbi:MAG: YHYH protein [Candidatus Poseidoniaceae archaeon]
MTDITFSSIGGYIVSMEIYPELPEGLTFDDQSGRISGTPTELIAETIFTVYANNSAGSGTATVTLSVIEQGYDATDLAQFWLDFFQCQSTDDRPSVDDLTTTAIETHQCEVSITLNETHLIITTNGLPNHDFESTLACSQAGDCATAQSYTWSIPRSPVRDDAGGHDSTNCPEANGDKECAPDRGAVAVAINGVPIYGPEDGPGGDAVAAHHGVYNEDRQPIELGICHGHAAQGGTYHYHADGNCMHWHPAEGESIENDYDESTIQAVAQNTYDGNHSKVIGVAFDGYPIYGFWGYDDQMNVVEMKSSYQLKAGETGYNGIDSYEYVEGLGHLDACNGHFGPTPDFPQGIYHYHTTMQNGNGDMGFPYFLICYHGEADMSSDAGTGQGGGDGNCDGFGETWGPGIGPPPPGCEGGPGAQSEISQISTELVFDPTVLIIFGLCLATAFWLRRNRNHP